MRLHGEVVIDRVYFLLDPDSCQIKIGTTRHLANRLSAHRRVRPNVELLGTMRGGRRLEAAMHARFEQYKREGEWFSSEICKEVVELLTYGDDPANIADVASRSVSAVSARQAA